MKKIFQIVVIIGLLFSIAFAIYHAQRNAGVSEHIVKRAVFPVELVGRKHILCIPESTTGYEWIMIQNEYGIPTYRPCRVIGEDGEIFNAKIPYEIEIGRSLTGGNVFVFYVDKRVKAEETIVTQFVATDWDILFPVKRDTPLEGEPNPSLYIIESDK